MDLHWVQEGERSVHLRAGCLEVDLATLNKAKKWWEAVVWLPGVSPEKQYAPLEDQKADLLAKVEHWFGLANTSLPAMEHLSGD